VARLVVTRQANPRSGRERNVLESPRFRSAKICLRHDPGRRRGLPLPERYPNMTRGRPMTVSPLWLQGSDLFLGWACVYRPDDTDVDRSEVASADQTEAGFAAGDHKRIQSV
jgi:hypothetical protein